MKPNDLIPMNADRASYELAYLLRELPRHLTVDPLTAEQQQMAAVAGLQAMNCSHALLYGLEAVGRVLWCASANKDNEIAAHDVGAIGILVSEIAGQLQFLGEFSSSVEDYERHVAQKGARK